MEAISYQSKIAQFVTGSRLKELTTIVLGSLIIAIAAQISIPLVPVPVTLQSFVILLLAMLCGPRLAVQMVLAYLVEGLCGLPVFANFMAGPAVLFSPVGGYLLGFIPATFIVGTLLQRGWARNILTILAAAIIATVILFICGYLGLLAFVGWREAYLVGVAPFYLIEATKLILFSLLTPFFWVNK